MSVDVHKPMQAVSQIQKEDSYPRNPDGYEVVVMAASLGGLQAFTRILASLPQDFPLPIVLLQHLSKPPSLLPEYLAWMVPRPITEARQGSTLRPGRVYTAPPGRHLLVQPGGTFLLSDSEPVWFVRPAADRLFESTASAFPGRAVAVVLTGRGQDGAAGVRAIRRSGGMVLVQSPASCKASGMPASAIETGCVDMILHLDKIAPMLESFVAPAVKLPRANELAAAGIGGGQL